MLTKNNQTSLFVIALLIRLLQLGHLLAELFDLRLLFGIHVGQLFCGISQCFYRDGELVFLRVNLVYAHHHQLGDFFGVAYGTAGFFLAAEFGLAIDFAFWDLGGFVACCGFGLCHGFLCLFG